MRKLALANVDFSFREIQSRIMRLRAEKLERISRIRIKKDFSQEKLIIHEEIQWESVELLKQSLQVKII